MSSYAKYNAGCNGDVPGLCAVVGRFGVPASILYLEKDPKQKKILRSSPTLALLFPFVSRACLFLTTFFQHFRHAHQYHFDFRLTAVYHGIFYFIPTAHFHFRLQQSKSTHHRHQPHQLFHRLTNFFNGYVIPSGAIRRLISALVFWVRRLSAR